MKELIIRNYSDADFNNYLEFIIDANQQDMSAVCVTPLLLDENLNHPLREPARDIFVAEQRGKIIGFCEIYPEIQIKRALLDALIHPAYRRQGVGSALLEKALSKSADIGADCVHVDVLEGNVTAKKFLRHQGFKNIRRYFNMSLDVNALETADFGDTCFEVRCCRHGEEKVLCDIQNKCFEDSWGFKPNTEAEVRYLVNTCGCTPEDVIFCFKGNHHPAGYCWTKINHEENKTLKRKKGRIHMLGVDQGYRGTGLGRIALMAGIRQLKTKGIEIVELTTDSLNLPAYELYQSVGFEHKDTMLWFEKCF